MNWEVFLSLRKLLFVMVDIFIPFFASINITIITITITTIVLLCALRRSIIFIAYFSDGTTARQGISYSVRSWILQTLEEPNSEYCFTLGTAAFTWRYF
jgi:hypothetical protein